MVGRGGKHGRTPSSNLHTFPFFDVFGDLLSLLVKVAKVIGYVHYLTP